MEKLQTQGKHREFHFNLSVANKSKICISLFSDSLMYLFNTENGSVCDGDEDHRFVNQCK